MSDPLVLATMVLLILWAITFMVAIWLAVDNYDLRNRLHVYESE